MNINGPSAIRVPDWVENPRGRYYLYFAHHHGRDIRIAVADDLLGPWTVHGRGVLDIEATAAHGHVASPDVHVDHEQRRLRMYFHGGASGVSIDQATFVASSKDGLDFAASPARLAPFYLRVFEHDGWFYGVGKRGNRSGILVRSEDPTAPFEAGATIIPRMRHAAVLKRDDDEAWVFYTRIGDEPESILAARIDLRGAWSCWRPEAGALVIAPERGYEGAEEPVEPSRPGIADGRRHELRDPAVYVEGHRTFLLYCVAGEQGIAIAELRPVS